MKVKKKRKKVLNYKCDSEVHLIFKFGKNDLINI